MNIYLYIALSFFISAIFLPGTYVVYAIPVVLTIIVLIDRPALRKLGPKKFWIWIIGGSFILPLVAGGSRVELLFFSFSLDLLLISFRMLARGFMLFSGMTLIRRHISLNSMSKLFMKLRLKKIAYLVPISFQIVPVILDTVVRTYTVWRQRGGFRANRIRNLSILITAIQLQIVSRAEELAIELYSNDEISKS